MCVCGKIKKQINFCTNFYYKNEMEKSSEKTPATLEIESGISTKETKVGNNILYSGEEYLYLLKAEFNNRVNIHGKNNSKDRLYTISSDNPYWQNDGFEYPFAKNQVIMYNPQGNSVSFNNTHYYDPDKQVIVCKESADEGDEWSRKRAIPAADSIRQARSQVN